MAENEKRYDLNETEQKSRLREFFAEVVHGKYYKDRLLQLFRNEAISRTVTYINVSAECLADGDAKLQSAFKIACADILDNEKDAKESLEYIIKQNEMAAYCHWTFDKKGEEEHLQKANEMSDILLNNVLIEGYVKCQEKGYVKMSFQEALEKMTTVLLRKHIEKLKEKALAQKKSLKPKQKIEENKRVDREK